jgi:hypothetical protein
MDFSKGASEHICPSNTFLAEFQMFGLLTKSQIEFLKGGIRAHLPIKTLHGLLLRKPFMGSLWD